MRLPPIIEQATGIILSTILVFVMTFSLISPSVVAADTEQTGILEETAQEIAKTADNDTLPEDATFYYEYVIEDADYNAGVRFDESYYEEVKINIKNGAYVDDTIIDIELSEDEKTMILYLGSNAGKEVNTVLQPYEVTQPTVVTNSALTEFKAWIGVDMYGKTQELSPSYYLGSAVQTYYGQNNTTFTSSLGTNYGFTYTLTLEEGQSFEDNWYENAMTAISDGTETGVLAIDKSADGRTMTLYFDSYDFYKTTLILPGVTLTDTSNTLFDNAWSDGTTVLATTANLSDYFAYDYDTQSYPNAYDMALSPVIATKTYTIHINLGEDGSPADGAPYTDYMTLINGGSASALNIYSDAGSLIIENLIGGGDHDFSLNTNLIEVKTGKIFDGFELDTSKTDSAVSCSIACGEEGKWQFTGFSSTDSEISHDIYVNVKYADTAVMYVDLSTEGIGTCSVDSIMANNSDIKEASLITGSDGKNALVLTARNGATISLADILNFEDGYYTETEAIVGTDGTDADHMAAVVLQKKAYKLKLIDSATGNTLYENDVVWGNSISFDDPTRTGYAFLGWSLDAADADQAGALPAVMPNLDAAKDTYPLGSLTYYTNWQIRTYRVTVSFTTDSIAAFNTDTISSWAETYDVSSYDITDNTSFVFSVTYDADLSIDMSVIIDSVSRTGFVLEGFFPKLADNTSGYDLSVITMTNIMQFDSQYNTSADGTVAYVNYSSEWTEITDSQVISTPTANTLIYTGSAQALITAGTASGGEMYYSLTGNGSDWSTELPAATDAGEYIVYYKVIGDTYHYDTDAASLNVTIGKASVTVAADNLTKNSGDSNPTLTFTITEGVLVGVDTKEALGVKLSTKATQSSEAGTYVITGTADSKNYDVTVLDGTLTIVALSAVPDQDFPDSGTTTIPDTSATEEQGVNAANFAAAKPTVSVKVAGANQIEVSWGTVSGADGYEIYMSTAKGSGYKLLATVDASKTTYTASKLKKNKTYYFKVRATATSGGKTIYSQESEVVSKKALGKPAKPSLKGSVSGSVLTLKWKKQSGIKKVVVYRKAGNGIWKAVKKLKGSSTSCKISLKGYAKNTKYSFYIKTYYQSDKVKIWSKASKKINVKL